MRKQRIVVFSKQITEGKSIASQLQSLFGDIFDVDSVSLESPINSFIFADLVLSTSYLLANEILDNLSPNTDVYVVRRTIMRPGFEKVMRIPRGASVLIAEAEDEARITASTLCELGAKHIHYLFGKPPFSDVEVDYAIVTSRRFQVPDSIAHVVDIGDRVLDPYGLFDILAKMRQLNRSTIERIINHMGNIMPRSDGFLAMIGNLEEDKRYTEQLMDVVREGILVFNRAGSILRTNKWAERLLEATASSLVGRKLDTVFPALEQRRIISEEEFSDEVFLINGRRCIVTRFRIQNGEGIEPGGIIVIRESTDIQRMEMKIRQNTIKSGHVAKYVFSDIIGISPQIRECVHSGTRMARANCSLLIQGESGTGKELFAQAIHNASQRKDRPFVAFNCAAVSDTLLESELFGYESGAFTGAKKGGHTGLFEASHTGTLFLDEIGDISRNMQAALLRVLQQREIIRVGGTDIIPIDVRIIAATNQDLLRLVKEGSFRADLYYRLDVMGLRIPPLRERKEDIPFLVEFMLGKRNLKRDVPTAVMDAMLDYAWPGNVRELENCVEYMGYISEASFTPDSLPKRILQGKSADAPAAEPHTVINDPAAGGVLEILRQRKNQCLGGIGRVALCEAMSSQGIACSEGSMKSLLKRLERLGLVEIAVGRGGTSITALGEQNLIRFYDNAH